MRTLAIALLGLSFVSACTPVGRGRAERRALDRDVGGEPGGGRSAAVDRGADDPPDRAREPRGGARSGAPVERLRAGAARGRRGARGSAERRRGDRRDVGPPFDLRRREPRQHPPGRIDAERSGPSHRGRLGGSGGEPVPPGVGRGDDGAFLRRAGSASTAARSRRTKERPRRSRTPRRSRRSVSRSTTGYAPVAPTTR
jgi:hypothetical protein